MVFDPHAPTPVYAPDRPAVRYAGDTRHNVGNITARDRRPMRTQDFDRLMRERPTAR